MSINIQPTLENNRVLLSPLNKEDFEELYLAASDSKIWEQHPNKDRWKREIFENFFNGALQSGGAYKIIDKSTSEIIGSTRFYDYDEKENTILIGYTFFKVSHWGKNYNHEVKKLMLDYIFQYVNSVDFHIGVENHRSLRSISKLGAKKIGEQQVTYFGEAAKLNAIFRIVAPVHEQRKED